MGCGFFMPVDDFLNFLIKTTFFGIPLWFLLLLLAIAYYYYSKRRR